MKYASRYFLMGTVAVQCVAAGAALAAGYGLREHSVTAMGSAYAGASASGSDASFLAYNPASLGEVGTYDASISMVALLPWSSARYPNSTTSAMTPAGGDPTQEEFVKTAYVPEIAARMRINDQFSAGLVVHVPWGLSTGYDPGWAGRYYGIQTRFLALDVTPTIAWNVTDSITVAAGPKFQYAKGKLSNQVDIGTIGALYSVPGSIPGGQDGNAVFTADDWGYGFVAGVMTELGDGFTVGLSYSSAVTHMMKGDLDFTLDGDGVGAALTGAGILLDTPARTVLTTPDTINLGARIALDERFTALFETNWTNWSRFRELRVESANPFQPDDVTVKRWEDSWFFALGGEYRHDASWTFRAGAALDSTPVPDSTRNPRIPDADRYWLSIGTTFQASESLGIGFSYAHMFLPENNVNMSAADTGNELRGFLDGRTRAGADVLGFQLTYKTP